MTRAESMRTLWMRWSWRDLRRRWVLVSVIALVIALGTGTYAALLSTSAWRTQSNDASFALLHTHDLRAALAQGTSVPEGKLLAIAESLPHAGQISAIRERLIVPTQVEGPHGLLVPGELAGTATAGAGSGVDDVHVSAGHALGPADDGRGAVVLEEAFAKQNRLASRGTLRVAGGATVRYTGIGQSPEYFIVTGGIGGTPFLSQKSYAVIFATLHTAQALSRSPGQVNDVVLTLKPGADRAVIARELRQAMTAVTPPISATVTTGSQIDSRRILYEDIKGDTELWRVIALLVFAGAAFAALNLTARIVEAQRREIGIGMALGVRPRLLALRPLLFGAQVALIGVVLGAAVGYVVGIPLRNVFTGLLPLPIWRTPFQAGTFAQAAVIGFVLPFAAVAWPVWRAMRVQPVEAIRVGHLAARGGGLAPLLRRLPLPGRSYRQIPVRNVLRTPRRSALTLLGIGAALATLVTIVGFLDTFRAAFDGSQRELLRSAPNRATVMLDSYYPADSKVVAAVRALPQVAHVQTGLLMPGTVRSGGRSVKVVAEVLPANPSWAPSIAAGGMHGGLVLARKAAGDLHVRAGDTVTLEHPLASGGGMRTAQTRIVVAGIHPGPMRVLAYLDSSGAKIFGLAGATNVLTAQPAPGHTTADVQRALLGVPHVASVPSVRVTTDGLRSSLDQFIGILNVAGAVTLLLALLIAFNNASIGVDERSREHATMMAYGLPLRTVLSMTTIEAVLIGALGTLVGVAGGYGLLSWIVTTTVPRVMPEIGVTVTLTAGSVLAALLLGLGTVALAPLFTMRRLRHMDVPSTLRVVE
ncbi:MAG: ABC transporter permease [Micromonosporaceae bacterium]